jgi:hypothetical protein
MITVLIVLDPKALTTARLSAWMRVFGRRTLKKQRYVVIHPSTSRLQVFEAVVLSSLGFVAFVLTSGLSSGATRVRN